MPTRIGGFDQISSKRVRVDLLRTAGVDAIADPEGLGVAGRQVDGQVVDIDGDDVGAGAGPGQRTGDRAVPAAEIEKRAVGWWRSH